MAWGASPTVITDRWWFNCKVDGTGVLLYDLADAEPFAVNGAAEYPDVANELFALALDDAAGGFPALATGHGQAAADAPGCSAIAART